METRWQREAEWHDSRVTGHDLRGGYFYRWGLSRVSKQYAYAQLGDLTARRVLDLGCGPGDDLVRLGLDGANAEGIDISQELVSAANATAKRLGLSQVRASVMPAEEMTFSDEYFDMVYGISILHHLYVKQAAQEVARVLRPGGRAVFLEPLGYNPFINLFQKLTPWRRTPDELPLCVDQLAELCEPFRQVHYAYFGLTSVLTVFLPIKPLFKVALRILESMDDALLRRWPSLGRYCWIVAIKLTK